MLALLLTDEPLLKLSLEYHSLQDADQTYPPMHGLTHVWVVYTAVKMYNSNTKHGANMQIKV